jgi:N6-adenosine-specific RNA methylase IME4
MALLVVRRHDRVGRQTGPVATMTWDGLLPPYATLVVDPPWPYDDKPTGYQRGETGGRAKARFLPYSWLTIEQITALPIADLARPAAHLYLWTTQRYLWDAKQVAEAWGWRVLKVLTWCKEPMGLGPGGAFATTTEFVLFCRRPVGSLIRRARESVGWSQNILIARVRSSPHDRIIQRWEVDDCYPTPADWEKLRHLLPALAPLPDLAGDPQPVDSTWWQWKRGTHSAKPPAFLDLVEHVSPSPHVELFARQPRLGWDSWGRGFENFGDSNRGVEHAL